MNIKKLIAYSAIILALVTGTPARAFTYNDGDVLLIFRSPGYNNLEFNLGNIGQFLNLPNGSNVVVTNWNLSLVTNTYSLTGGNVQFAVIASSNSAVATESWVSDSLPLKAENDFNLPTWNTLYSKVNGIGTGAASDTLQSEAPSGTNYLDINPSGTTERYSFDYIASNNGQNPSLIPTLGGGVGQLVSVTGATPGTILFYQIIASSVTPKPAATLVGSFKLGADGSLTFTAGPLLDAAQINSIAVSGQSATVTFPAKPAVKYRLLYSTQANARLTNWTQVGSPIAGTGSAATPANLTDPNATDPARFYSIQSYP
jgi:hypothetical protein